MNRCLNLAFLLVLLGEPLHAFVPLSRSKSGAFRLLQGATTVEPPTREKTDRKTDRKTGRDDKYTDDGKEDVDYPDLEYLIDSAEAREMEDPFHILLLQSTFDKPKITVSYVAGSLEYVLAMPYDEAVEQSKFAKEEGFSCLGTWPREECLSFGRQLQMRDIACRVVPYVEGGQRGWQVSKRAETAL
uniref:Uncharacterized protein n=1 Tax=Amphora coffeiformis TaxID=265554 RepID=A0A7S3L4S5_9STRA|mmetsp:Transcript_13997/g.26827  ORF Transcript_13997/g.26827 Transcript_13997/m.26827 type:complete len:187 (-) Transcript_13997:94-654(-)|eukprot:scaffold7349_cov173-Amphora_coffeaeformis.AAC.103